jgi:hypothetical protein
MTRYTVPKSIVDGFVAIKEGRQRMPSKELIKFSYDHEFITYKQKEVMMKMLFGKAYRNVDIIRSINSRMVFQFKAYVNRLRRYKEEDDEMDRQNISVEKGYLRLLSK